MYTYKIGISAEEHDAFVKQHPQNNLLQSSSWAKVKDNWGNERVGFYQDQTLVAVASILIQPLPLGWTMMYIPRGPIMDYTNQTLVRFVVKSLKQIAKKYRSVFIKFDPNLHLKQYHIGETVDEKQETLTAINSLITAGATWSGRTLQIQDSIQPRFQANVYTTEQIVNTFPKHTKRLMKDAQTRGVISYRGTSADLKEFAAVVALTESRKGVSLRNYDYFKKMSDIYQDDLYLHLAKVNITKRLAEYKEQLASIETELATTEAHQKKRLTKLNQQKASVEKYIKEFEGFASIHPQEVVIAGILSIRFGNVMEMLYAGMNDDFRKFYPQYSLYPTVFQEAFEDGIVWANMGGVEGSLDDGLTKFKSNFNPTIEEYIGEFSLATSLLSPLFQLAYTIRKKIRNNHS
ncbi:MULTISPECIES: aminoacyltransferase [unclassified Streptococcus]|uniref:aminoacyltransferase n=1 Tax=unclassified Streptococcus TaxID=2608887 RepID=UPI001071FB68|nr:MULTISPECIES: aminoacyltransferase [unclassified Streptococcus]MBF0787645.1 aminoacyltransferase [Streptococcus sp. 19428wC2_LYSM12]MCQ9212218.1 aminoacyltransferase [Streptococcus sp. B01]MCQ9213548.1 aminoacyltransferase [Streptococcus sp. O1]TFV05396.1 aminoacyltransferase [Streptococcus sp. LYSM12]